MLVAVLVRKVALSCPKRAVFLGGLFAPDVADPIAVVVVLNPVVADLHPKRTCPILLGHDALPFTERPNPGRVRARACLGAASCLLLLDENLDYFPASEIGHRLCAWHNADRGVICQRTLTNVNELVVTVDDMTT